MSKRDVRITVSLRAEEAEALIALAERERRRPREQAAECIRGFLELSGLLSLGGLARLEVLEEPLSDAEMQQINAAWDAAWAEAQKRQGKMSKRKTTKAPTPMNEELARRAVEITAMAFVAAAKEMLTENHDWPSEMVDMFGEEMLKRGAQIIAEMRRQAEGTRA